MPNYFSTIHFHENKGFGCAEKGNLMEVDQHRFTCGSSYYFDQCIHLCAKDKAAYLRSRYTREQDSPIVHLD